uniref:Putative LRR receptor-like serine/threonine-protein kinase n=1 Tax=Aegilops tauschii TaxID=37682 RepID=R7WF09_AEGTA
MSPSLLLKFLYGLLLASGEVVLIAAQSHGGGDEEVLVELKRFLVANNRFNRGGYDGWQESDPSPCGWWGIGCDGNGRVESLNLTGSAISGPAFGSFSRLSALTSLDLSCNSITGPLPDGDLNQCHGLLHLNFSHNLITESLNVTGLTRLQVLDVLGNRLQGSVAVNFPAICADLTLLDLSTNNLTDNITKLLDSCQAGIPTKLTNCRRLRFLDISTNKFGGDMQEIFGNFTILKYLVLHDNNYTGGIVASGVLRLPLLARLDLSFNEFTGEPPSRGVRYEEPQVPNARREQLLRQDTSGVRPANQAPSAGPV